MIIEILRPFARFIIGFAIAKGIVIGTVVTAVVHAGGLSPFAQALIISIISATIGALGLIIAALITVNSQERIISEQKELSSHLRDVKAAVGASHRKADKH